MRYIHLTVRAYFSITLYDVFFRLTVVTVTGRRKDTMCWAHKARSYDKQGPAASEIWAVCTE
jgi:hypothetical protein